MGAEQGILSERQKRSIAGRARSLYERLGGLPNEEGGHNSVDPDRVIQRWNEQFPDEATFQQRLEHDGLTEETLWELCAGTVLSDEEPLPDWVVTLDELIEYVEGTPAARRRQFASQYDEEPFEELLATIVEYARERLPEEAVPGTVSTDAVTPMAGSLQAQLSRLCTRVLYVEFKTFVTVHDEELASADHRMIDDPPTAYYEQFIDAVFDGGFTNLCVEYPVLARHVVQLLEHWIDAVTECCDRIRADRSALCDRFNVDDRAEITALDPLAIDAHAEGRVPVRVEFDDERAVVYKPRSVALGVALYTILDRLDDRLSVPSFKGPAYLQCENYGWMEWIPYREPEDERAVERYYERAGALLCLAYVLELTDCQYENVIVHGEYPMIVDAETMFHPYIEPAAKATRTEVAAFVYDTVLLTSLLPWSAGEPRDPAAGSEVTYLAGLGSGSEPVSMPAYQGPSVEAINTDVMSVGTRVPEIDRRTNTPSIDGADHPPDEYTDLIVRGFDEAYETIRELHVDGRFLSEILTPELLDGAENRVVYRATQRYGAVLHALASMDALRDGVRASVEIETLAVPFFDGQIEDERCWELYRHEHDALWNLDFPRFTSHPDDTELSIAGSRTSVHADVPGYERCRTRLDAMTEADRRRQGQLIRGSFEANEEVEGTPLERSADSGSVGPSLTDDQLRQRAIELFDLVTEAALDTGTEPYAWVSIIPHGQANLILTPANESVYSGRSGIAITAAALYRETGDEAYRRLTEQTLRPVIEGIDEPTVRPQLGGLMGTGSVVYALSVVGDLLDDRTYHTAATAAARSVTDELLANSEEFDVTKGSAGTLLGLLACYDRCGDPDVLDRAIACGDHLLDGRQTIGGVRAWETLEDDEPTPGFSHGVSGIAYALTRLGDTANEQQYVDAAREALAYEETLYSESHCNWRSNPRRTGTEYVDRWCHGRAGIALARTAMGRQLDDEALLTEARAAANATVTDQRSVQDHLCCGNFGRVELLIEASRTFELPADAARAFAERSLDQQVEGGTLWFANELRSLTDPTFFGGVAGIAYTLLRLRDPASLPCVLLME